MADLSTQSRRKDASAVLIAAAPANTFSQELAAELNRYEAVSARTVEVTASFPPVDASPGFEGAVVIVTDQALLNLYIPAKGVFRGFTEPSARKRG